MAEMHTISCPSCDASNQPRAAVDGIQEYRCRVCGLVYYGPCGCDTVHDDVVGAPVGAAAQARVSYGACTVAVAGDWETTTPAVDAHDRAAMQAHPGC